MSKQHEIKVFKPRSKQADFTIKAVTPEAGVSKIGSLLNQGVEVKVKEAFAALKSLGADHVSFHAGDRRIKVQLATAA